MQEPTWKVFFSMTGFGCHWPQAAVSLYLSHSSPVRKAFDPLGFHEHMYFVCISYCNSYSLLLLYWSQIEQRNPASQAVLPCGSATRTPWLSSHFLICWFDLVVLDMPWEHLDSEKNFPSLAHSQCCDKEHSHSWLLCWALAGGLVIN